MNRRGPWHRLFIEPISKSLTLDQSKVMSPDIASLTWQSSITKIWVNPWEKAIRGKQDCGHRWPADHARLHKRRKWYLWYIGKQSQMGVSRDVEDRGGICWGCVGQNGCVPWGAAVAQILDVVGLLHSVGSSSPWAWSSMCLIKLALLIAPLGTNGAAFMREPPIFTNKTQPWQHMAVDWLAINNNSIDAHCHHAKPLFFTPPSYLCGPRLQQCHSIRVRSVALMVGSSHCQVWPLITFRSSGIQAISAPSLPFTTTAIKAHPSTTNYCPTTCHHKTHKLLHN